MTHIIEQDKIKKVTPIYPSYLDPDIWKEPINSYLFGTEEYPIEINPKKYYYSLWGEQITKILEPNITIDVSGFQIKLPQDLQSLASEIENSKYILELEEDWDGECGRQFDFTTWKRAVTFIVEYAMWLYKSYHYILKPPQINPGPGNSIDLLWRNSQIRLLVNIPNNLEYPISYYGDNNRGENSIKGKLKDDSVQEFFALWLMNMKK